VLLALYRARGEAMLPLLNGIFAFAIWDSDQQALLLACDAMGVKPLYFSEAREGFVFASELKALVRCAGIERSLDVAALSRYLAFLWSPGGATPLRGVARLGPGEAMRVKDGRTVRRWCWAPSTWEAAPARLDDAAAIREVREGLRRAVHRQLVSDVPVGAFLSGGLDSSSVVAMARELLPDIACFTIDTGGATPASATICLPRVRWPSTLA
jgi:asparagine synthase (glutamine-hydrolysing)